jgi:hypothetical protein
MIFHHAHLEDYASMAAGLYHLEAGTLLLKEVAWLTTSEAPLTSRETA